MASSTISRRTRLIGGCALVAILGGLAFPAAAQSAAASDQAQPDKLPELVVTAERRVQNLQQTPISATVLGATQLEREGVNKVADLQQVSPSLAINTYNRSTFINIRGVGIAVSAPTSSPGVAYYIDGAFIAHEFYVGNTFYDLESVEVLRGPQGTLTGQNSTGGAIYTRTAEPKFDKISGYFDQTAGDYNETKTVGAMNIPITPNLAIRLAGTHEQRDSFYTNVGGPNQPGNINFTSWRANAEYKPNDKLQINVRYENDDNNNHGNAYKNRFSLLPTLPNGSVNPIYNPNPFQISEDAMGFYRQTMQRTDVEAKYMLLPDLQLRYLVSYQYGKIQDLVDGDRSIQPTTQVLTGLPANAKGRLGATSTTNNVLINEFDLISQGDGPLQYVFGVFGMDETVPVILDNDGTGTINLSTATPSQLGGTGPNLTYGRTINTSRSVFGQVTYRFDKHWQLIVGGRYSRDIQSYTRVGIPGFPLSGAPYASNAISEQPTGRVALNYQLNDDTLLYASASRGYKAGGVNLTQANPAINLPANFKPETNTVEEFGIKTDLFDHHLRVNADGFVSQYQNMQLSTLTNTVPANPYTANLPNARTYGVELELLGRWNGWTVNAGAAYLNAKTASTFALADASVNPSVLRSVASGTTLPFSPEFTGNIGVEYSYFYKDWRMTPRVQVSYVTKQWATIFETQGPTGLQPGATNTATLVPEHTLVDLHFTVVPAPMPNLQAELFITNVFDTRYIASQVQDSSSANGGIIYGAPRQIGGRVIYKF